MFTFLWLLLIIGSIAYYHKHIPEDIKDSNTIRKDLKPKHFLIGTLSILSVLTTGTLLIKYIPGMTFGWLTWLASKTSETQTGQAMENSPILWGAIVIMILVFAVFLPKFALLEEETFRKPYIWSNKHIQLIQSLKFGLVHLIMGIPLGAALALSIGGIFFMETATRTAKKTLDNSLAEIPKARTHDEIIIHVNENIHRAEKEGIWQSTLIHTAHNYIAMGLCLTLSALLFIVQVSSA